MPTKAQQAYEKLEQDQNVLLEGVGPALVAVAITSKPHLDQRRAGQKSKRIEIVEINGEKVVKIPLMEKALYKHPNGNLNFNDPFISRLIDNFNKKVTGKPVYLDFRHGDNQGALAYLDPEDGGWLERGKDDDWLYAYGKPVVDNIEQMVRQWPHASVEFAPNYEANFVQKLSTDDLSEISIDDLLMEEIMPKKLTLGNKVITLEGEVQDVQVSEIEAAYVALQNQVTKLEAEVEKLTPKPEPQLPEAFRVQLEELQAANKRLEAERRAEKVNLVLERARNYRDSRGYGHDKTFLELAEAALKLEAYEQNGSTIRLEGEDGKPNPVAFYSKVIMTMLEKVPGTVPMSGKTQADDYRLEASDAHYTAEEFEKAQAEFWN